MEENGLASIHLEVFMARTSSGTIPLALDLKEAVELAKDIYERGGGVMTQDDIAALMKLSSKSSGFRMRLAAMRSFGLIQTEGQSVRLTQRARAIVAPSSAKEYQTTIVEAFISITVFAYLHGKYQGGYLPEDTFLANTIVKELSSPSEHKEKWVRSFTESARAAGLLREESGKMRVLRTPSPAGGFVSEQSHEKKRQEPREEEEQRKSDYEQKPMMNDGLFPVVLDENKRTAYLPLDLTKQDLEYLTGVLDFYVKRREAKT